MELSQYVNTSQTFYLKMLKLISILICNEIFHAKKSIPVRYVQTVCNIKPRPWSQILGSGPEVLILVFDPDFQARNQEFLRAGEISAN